MCLTSGDFRGLKHQGLPSEYDEGGKAGADLIRAGKYYVRSIALGIRRKSEEKFGESLESRLKVRTFARLRSDLLGWVVVGDETTRRFSGINPKAFLSGFH
jgi:hypothetical protein